VELARDISSIAPEGRKTNIRQHYTELINCPFRETSFALPLSCGIEYCIWSIGTGNSFSNKKYSEMEFL
jgi:hypothetical protein